MDEGTGCPTAGGGARHGRGANINSVAIGVMEESGVSPWITGL